MKLCQVGFWPPLNISNFDHIWFLFYRYFAFFTLPNFLKRPSGFKDQLKFLIFVEKNFCQTFETLHEFTPSISVQSVPQKLRLSRFGAIRRLLEETKTHLGAEKTQHITTKGEIKNKPFSIIRFMLSYYFSLRNVYFIF